MEVVANIVPVVAIISNSNNVEIPSTLNRMSTPIGINSFSDINAVNGYLLPSGPGSSGGPSLTFTEPHHDEMKSFFGNLVKDKKTISKNLHSLLCTMALDNVKVNNSV